MYEEIAQFSKHLKVTIEEISDSKQTHKETFQCRLHKIALDDAYSEYLEATSDGIYTIYRLQAHYVITNV